MPDLTHARKICRGANHQIALAGAALLCLIGISTPANATLVFNTAACATTAMDGGTPTGGCSVAALPVGPNGVEGLTMTGNVVESEGADFTGVTLAASGSTSGTYSGTLPILWDFTINEIGGFTYSLTIAVNGVTVVQDTSTMIGSASPSVSISGASTWSIQLAVTSTFGDSNPITISIPAGSIDINSVPEPATFQLAALALPLLAWRRRREYLIAKALTAPGKAQMAIRA